MTDIEQSKIEGWAIVEVMGHNVYAGKVSTQALGVAAFLRVDVPEVDGVPAFTKLLGASSIFGITPVTEEFARAAVARFRKRPLVDLGLTALPSPPRESDLMLGSDPDDSDIYGD